MDKTIFSILCAKIIFLISHPKTHIVGTQKICLNETFFWAQKTNVKTDG